MNTRHTQFGYSLVEVLVAISVLSIAMIGPMTIASQGIKSSRFSLEQNAAFFLAQEGIEAVFAIRNNAALEDIEDGFEPANDNSWNWLNQVLRVGGPCPDITSGGSCSFGIDFRDTTLSNNMTPDVCDAGNEARCLLYDDGTEPAVYTHTGSNASPYTRIVTVSYASDQSVKVESTITWESQVFGGQTQRVTLTSYLFDSNYEDQP